MRRRTKTKKQPNWLVGAIFFVLVVGICFVFYTRTENLKEQNELAKQELEQLTAEIIEEEERAKDLDEYAKYVNTKQYVEDMAREKLGLIYPGELVFKAE